VRGKKRLAFFDVHYLRGARGGPCSETLADDDGQRVLASRVPSNPERNLVLAVLDDRTLEDERGWIEFERFLSANLRRAGENAPSVHPSVSSSRGARVVVEPCFSSTGSRVASE